MVITDFLERNARLYGSDIALVEVNPSEERDSAVTWREASLIAEAQPDAPYRRELSWRDFDRRANRFANFLLSRNVRRGTKVGILLMNCLEWLPIYFGILKAGCIAVPLNFRYASDEISYCLDLADVEVLVFGPEFVSRLDPIQAGLTRVRLRLFVGRNVPDYAEDCRRLMGFCSSSVPPVALDENDDAAIYFSSGTTGFPKAILHRHKALVCSCITEQHHHGQTKRGRVSLYSAALSYRGENALVREPHFRRKGRASARREAGVDPADGHGRKMHHRLAAGPLGAGYSGRH